MSTAPQVLGNAVGDALKRRRAYREANHLVTWAGVILAAAGTPKDAPELEALREAVKALREAVKALRAAEPKP